MPTKLPDTELTYWLEQSDAETRRLIRQSQIVNSVTREVLRDAGLGPGMKVLDVGTGPGDVALIAASIVGPEGEVLGLDLNPDVLVTARARAAEAGLDNVTFLQGDCQAVNAGQDFDAVVGRAILLYVQDHVPTLRSILDRLRPGGIVAFQEFNVGADAVRSVPLGPTWQRVGEWVATLAEASGLNTAMGFDLHRTFLAAGLPAPRMRIDAEVSGDPDWDGYGYLAETFRSMLPRIHALGIATPDEVEIDTLAVRLREEVLQASGVGKSPDLVSAWTRKP